VDIIDSTADAFKMMIDYIYQNEDKSVEKIDDVKELFDVYYLAEKYEVLGWKEIILDRFGVMDVDIRKYEAMLKSVLTQSCFEDACKVVERRIFDFIKVHGKPLELVQGALDTTVIEVKCKVLDRLVSVDDNSILETVRAAQNILKSESGLNEECSFVPVMKSCAGKFEELRTDPLKFSQIVPDPYSDLLDAYIFLVQFMKQNFCRNCESSACKKNKKNSKSDLKVGTRVRLDGVRKAKGRVSKVELVKVAKTPITKTFDCCIHKSSDCSSSCNGRRFSCCPLCKFRGGCCL